MNSSIKIPDQLRRQRFIKTYEKRPVEPNWTLDPSLYLYDTTLKQWSNIINKTIYVDSKTSKPYSEEKLTNYHLNDFKPISTTYGVLCGYNGLFVIDCDNKEIEEYLMKIEEFSSTFIVKTASSKLSHFYFLDTDNRHPTTIRIDDSKSGKRICDIQGVGTQVIGPGSYLNIEGKDTYYTILNDVHIKQVSYQKILDMVLEFSKDTIVHTLKSKSHVVNIYEETDEIIKQIKSKINIPMLLKEWGIDTTKNPCDSPFTLESNNRKCLSFTDEMFNDFHTGYTGSMFHLYMYYFNVDFLTAKYHLQLMAGIKDNDKSEISFLKRNFRFFYFLNDNSARRFGVIYLKNNSVSYHSKTELVEYLCYQTPEIFTEMNVPISVNMKKQQQTLFNIVDKYLNNFENIEVLKGLGYKPSNEIIYNYDDSKYLNSYIAPKFPYNVVTEEVTEKNFENMYKIIAHLCKNDKNIIDYFMNWLAHILQNPTVKLPTSFIFMGAHGTGKGVLRNYILNYLFGSNNVTEITQNTIIRGWGDYIRNTQIIFADEINLHARIHTEVCDRLKNNTTNEQITVDIKGKNSQKIQNYSHWIFTSNKELPFQIEHGDRRYIVIEQLTKIDTQTVSNIDPRVNINTHTKEIYALYNYLKTLKPNFIALTKPLETEEKHNLIKESENNTVKFIDDMRSFENFKDFLYELKIKVTIVEDTVPSQDIYNIFKKWCENNGTIPSNKINFGRELSKRYNIISKLKRVLDVPQRVYYIGELMSRDVKIEDIPKHINDGTDELKKDFEL